MKRTVSACGASAYGVSATKTANALAGVSASSAMRSVSVSVLGIQQMSRYCLRSNRCKNGCGRLYKDWYGELVCPICGYHEYLEDEYENTGTNC